MKELSKTYNPKEAEDGIYRLWEEKGMFDARVSSDKKPYSIVIPPPNITGILHMGHALNNTIQDILIRYKKMKGYESLWMPGTDHAGIATQNVVERKLAGQGKKRNDIGREKFIQEVWKWRDEYGGTIIEQLKRLGAACDWKRERFTMDEGLSGAVTEVFIRLYNKGLIYRGNYIINWCPRCQTALSDEEAEHRDIDGKLYYIRYAVSCDKITGAGKGPGKDTAYITVATTRPETMLGDTAVAVNPKDKRYKHLIGKSVILPILNRKLVVIADDQVDPDFGTGIVKITPAHDPNDFQTGKRHNLEEINIMRPDAVLNENAGRFEGMDRFKAREQLVNALNEMGLIERIEPHRHSVGHCYRCCTIVEPYISKQWFVHMKPLAKPAIQAVESNDIVFYPSRWKKVYLDWMYNIRDWCISRQIWWGHRLPVYYCRQCSGSEISKNNKKEKGVIVSNVRPEKCPDCGGSDIIQDEDVLDTWFSSWLWPFSAFGWPFSLQCAPGHLLCPGAEQAAGSMPLASFGCGAESLQNKSAIEKQKQEFKYFYPTSCLVTAQEIIFFWVARMIMAGLEFCDKIPFKDVYIHGTVRDDTGTKMSKSLGNTIDPIEIIGLYGADALRFSIISITAAGQDVFLSKNRFESGRNFANKLWNVARFVLMNRTGGALPDPDSLSGSKGITLADRWIVGSFYQALDLAEEALSEYRFNDAANIVYEFVWHKYCDWYIEITKSDIHDLKTQEMLILILQNSLKLLHPFMPFITEHIWQEMELPGLIMASNFPPKARKGIIDIDSMQAMDRLMQIIVAIRNIRAEMGIAHKQEIEAIVIAKGALIDGISPDLTVYSKQLANVSKIIMGCSGDRPKYSASSVLDFCEIFVPLEGVIDIKKEQERLKKDLRESEAFLKCVNAKLNNQSFIEKAPCEIVQSQKQKAALCQDKIRRIKENIKNLT